MRRWSSPGWKRCRTPRWKPGLPPHAPKRGREHQRPVADAYYITLAGNQRGPFTPDELRQLNNNHTVNPSTMCWCQGMATWTRISEALPEFFEKGNGERLAKLEGFSLIGFFSDVFKRHEAHETVNLFCCGSATTTPPLAEVNTNWPNPWIFARLIIVCALLYLGFD